MSTTSTSSVVASDFNAAPRKPMAADRFAIGLVDDDRVGVEVREDMFAGRGPAGRLHRVQGMRDHGCTSMNSGGTDSTSQTSLAERKNTWPRAAICPAAMRRITGLP